MQQEGHPACNSSATTISKSLLLLTGLTWSNLTWGNLGKMGRLNKNRPFNKNSDAAGVDYHPVINRKKRKITSLKQERLNSPQNM